MEIWPCLPGLLGGTSILQYSTAHGRRDTNPIFSAAHNIDKFPLIHGYHSLPCNAIWSVCICDFRNREMGAIVRSALSMIVKVWYCGIMSHQRGLECWPARNARQSSQNALLCYILILRLHDIGPFIKGILYCGVTHSLKCFWHGTVIDLTQ